MQTNLFSIIEEKKIPPTISHLIWDVNGTITSGDSPDPDLLQMIVNLAELGVDHSFITGRDKDWLFSFLVTSLKEAAGEKFARLANRFHLYPELGLIRFDPASGETSKNPAVEDHPLLKEEIKEKLADLFYRASRLESYDEKKQVPAGFFVGKDADNNAFLLPKTPPDNIPYPWFIWRPKTVMASAEVIRNPDTTIRNDCADKINESVIKLNSLMAKWGLNEKIRMSPVSTAINIVPIVMEHALDKDMGARTAIYFLANLRGVDAEEVRKETMAIGDGQADLLFTTFLKANLPLAFVGDDDQFQPNPIQLQGVALRSKKIGPPGTKDVLKFLDPCFKSLGDKNRTIYLRAEAGLEVPSQPEVRGITKRIKHEITPGGPEYHIAELPIGIEQPHIHAGEYETIILLEGKIIATSWDKQQGEFCILDQEGDSVTFPPGKKHNLIRLKPSKVVTFKGYIPAYSREREATGFPWTVAEIKKAIDAPLSRRVFAELETS